MELLGRRPLRGVAGPPSWICHACRESEHEDCIGRGHCDCQHRTAQPSEPATGPAGE